MRAKPGYISVALLWVAGNDLLHLLLCSARQVEEVVAPVGGGRLVDRAPHQASGLSGSLYSADRRSDGIITCSTYSFWLIGVFFFIVAHWALILSLLLHIRDWKSFWKKNHLLLFYFKPKQSLQVKDKRRSNNFPKERNHWENTLQITFSVQSKYVMYKLQYSNWNPKSLNKLLAIFCWHAELLRKQLSFTVE